MLKVAKFGGSSMADAGQFKKVGSIISADAARRIVVVSAAGKRFSDDHKITDLLYLCYSHIQYGVSCDDLFATVCDRYRAIRDGLGLKTDIEKDFETLLKRIHEKTVSRDELVSRGEYFAAKLMADYLGFDFLDATMWVKFGPDGEIDRDATYEAFAMAAGGRKVVTPGFYGALPDGSIRVMPRGGSDITGALAAAALEADLYENFTDVSGILMADPRIVKNPKPIARITYNELRELSYIGAQVLHEGTVFPVREKHIPLAIKNTNDPDAPGTLIMESFDAAEDTDGGLITGIAGRKDFTVITVAGSGLSSEVGILRRILEVFEKHGISVEYVPSGIDCVSLVAATAKISGCLYSILGQLQKEIRPDDLRVTENIAIIAAVGRKMMSRSGTSGKIFAALGEAGINIRMITQGPDELNIIFGVDNKDFAKSIEVLYDNFVR